MQAFANAVLFDFDGVIVDTEWPIYEAWADIYKSEGQHLAPEVYVQCVGSDFDTWSAETHLEELTGKSYDWDAINPPKQEKIKNALSSPKLLPGVLATLESCKNQNIPVTIVSSSTHEWVDSFVDKVEIKHLIRCTICREDAAKIKPAPDLYLEAIKQLAIPANQCLVIEDSLNGTKAGVSAGCQTCVVPSKLTASLDFSIADAVIKSLHDLNISPIL